MSVERESLSELQKQRESYDSRFSKAQSWYERSSSLEFNVRGRLVLDPTHPDYAERTIRLGAARRRVRESIIPQLSGYLAQIDERIGRFTIDEMLDKKRAQLVNMQELVSSGDLTRDHLKPIIDEIASIEARSVKSPADEGVIRLGPPQPAAPKGPEIVTPVPPVEPESTPSAEDGKQTQETEVDRAIEEIQRLSHSGILTNPRMIIQTQEIARQLGKNFWIFEIGDENEGEETGTDEGETGHEEEENPSEEFEFNDEEAAVLARLILSRTEIKIKLNNNEIFSLSLDEGEAEALHRLVDSWTEPRLNRDLTKMRDEVLKKTERFFQRENADDLILDKFDGDLRGMLVNLYYLYKVVTPSHLFEFLESGLDSKQFSNDVYDWVKRVIRAQSEEVGQVSYQTVSVGKVEPMRFSQGEVEEARITEQERKDRDELILLALDSIMDDQGSLTANEVLGLFGKMKDGRNYSYPTAVNSIYRCIARLQITKLENTSEGEKRFLEKVRTYVGSEIDEDPQILRTKLKEKLISWFKEKLSQKEGQSDSKECSRK